MSLPVFPAAHNTPYTCCFVMDLHDFSISRKVSYVSELVHPKKYESDVIPAIAGITSNQRPDSKITHKRNNDACNDYAKRYIQNRFFLIEPERPRANSARVCARQRQRNRHKNHKPEITPFLKMRVDLPVRFC